MSKSTKPAAKPAAKKSVKKAGTPLRERLGALLTSAPEVRLSIRVKMVIYMSVIFLTMLAILNIFVARNVTAGNEKYINDDLVTQKNNGLIYVKQMLVLNGRDNDEEGFAAIAPALVEEISGATGSPTAAFDTAGEMLAATNSQVFIENSFGDVGLARGGLSAFTLNTEGSQTRAYFSYPVVIEGKTIGLIRTVNDYSILYKQGNNTVRSVTIITIIVFAVSLLATLVFAHSIATPIMKLAGISEALQKDVEQNKIDVGKVVRLSRSRRRDEIGILSRNFAEMIYRIDQQMKTIDSDRYELKRLSEYRKVFYDNVTHELKTPLTSIKGYAEVLEENGFTDKEFFDKGISHIMSESDRMYNMVVTLLELSRMSDAVNVPKERVNLNDLMQQVCEGMQFKAEKFGDAIELTVRQRAVVMGSDTQLKEIFINIIDNAIKYGYPNSTIQVLVNSNRENVTVQVVNSGEGIDEKEIPKLFIPFYRRKDKTGPREEGSSGLGLGIVKQLVEQHGGRIDITSRPKGLTVVTVILPTARAREGQL